MTNITIYSPLEQFEFFLISLYPQIENLYMFFILENNYISNVLDNSTILNTIFYSDYYSNMLERSPSVIIEGVNTNITAEIEKIFIIEQFKIGINKEIWSNLGMLGNDVRSLNENQQEVITTISQNQGLLQLLEIFSHPYSVINNEIQDTSDLNIALRFSEKDWTNFTFFWLNVYNSITIVLVLFIVFFIFCNILGNNVNFLNVWMYIIDLFFSFLLQNFVSLANKKLVKYFQIFCVFFLFIFLSNLTALVPFSFCLTSNLWFTLTLSLSVWVSVTLLAIIVRGTGFFKGFVPSNVPAALKGFITVIEVISYLARAVSLGVRIFANMLAGHSLVHILSDLVETCIISFDQIFLKIFGIFPAIILTFILFIEFGICFLQALVFVILTAIYLNEAFGFAGH
jgi:F-type H+-transporting ATPase subunit a